MSKVIAALLLLVTLPVASVADNLVQPDDTYYRNIAEADRLLDMGDVNRASRILELLLEDPLPDVPNHLPHILLAGASCLANGCQDGKERIRDATCMVEVLEGKQSCFKDGYPRRIERSEGLTDICFREMCGEVFVGQQVVNDTELVQARDALRRARQRCGKAN